MNKPVNIVLVLKSGGDFKMSDVYLLAAHINRYWANKNNKPNIYCFTDLVSSERNVVGLTILPLPHPTWNGWWSKLNLFSPDLQPLRPFLYMDLDTAIVGNIDSIVPPNDKKSAFITLRDFYQPAHLASGVMWIPDTQKMNKVYYEWIANQDLVLKRFRGDQNYIETITSADFYWQDVFGPDFIVSFKPNKQWRTELIPQNSIVCFHGEPRIPKAALSVEWVKDYVGYVI